MELFNEITNDLQEVTTLETKAYNKLIDIRQKLLAADWQQVWAWQSEWFVSPTFIAYANDHNLPKSKMKNYFEPDLTPADKWYGHILYIREED
jgi:hypothetical protein